MPASETDLVISTENELTRFKVKERIFSNWTKEQGLMAVNFNPHRAYTPDQDILYSEQETEPLK